MMDIQYLRDHDLILLECISGSRAYGLDTPTSDTDIKGVFLLPKAHFYGLDYIPQISNPTNDIVFYELGRFIELLSNNNPNILELLNTPEHALIYKHPIINRLQPEQLHSKQCLNSFGKFALSQIKKAKGLKKKIVNPMEVQRKSVLDFCYVNYQQGAVPVAKYLSLKGWAQNQCGLTNIPHMKNVYGLYHSTEIPYKGIVKNEDADDVRLSSIPKGEVQAAVMYFNKDGYSSYCKDYKEYWTWVEERNEDRYLNTQSHGKNYDAKNMMHTFRLLQMAIEIGRDHQINVKRPNRDFLLKIKSGHFGYEELLQQANDLQKEMEAVFERSDLPETPDREMLNDLLVEMREQLYV